MVFRKCSTHSHRGLESDQLIDLTDIVETSPFIIQVAFHFLAPVGSYNTQKVELRAYDIILSLNDDWNNYSNSPNLMNNFRYKSVISQVFPNNASKQTAYLRDLIQYVPTKPSNITFEIGQVYYYDIKNRLSLSQYDDPDIEYQAIKSYINRNKASAILPEYFLNIWIVDMADTDTLGFASHPFSDKRDFDGVIIHRRAFFPEDYDELDYCRYKTVSHQVGHYLGLSHAEDFEPNPIKDTKLQSDTGEHNRFFMNPMTQTIDRYVTNFTPRQLADMRYVLQAYRHQLNGLRHDMVLPKPTYRPEKEAPLTRPIKQRVVKQEPKRQVKEPEVEVLAPEEESSEEEYVPMPNIPMISNPDSELIRNIREHMPAYTPQAKPGIGEKLTRVATELKALKTEMQEKPKYNRYNQLMTPTEPQPNVSSLNARFIRQKPKY